LIAQNEAVEAGHFRSEGKEKLKPGAGLGMHGRYLQPSTEPGGENLRRSFTRGVEFIRTELDYVFEQAIAYFLFAALQQFRREQAHCPVPDEWVSRVAWI
jgi:hypothetical protein